MMKIEKYCTICGKKREIVKSGKFNENDGKPEFHHAECDVKDCKHGCHNYKPVQGKFGLCKGYQCSVCGGWKPEYSCE